MAGELASGCSKEALYIGQKVQKVRAKDHHWEIVNLAWQWLFGGLPRSLVAEQNQQLFENQPIDQRLTDYANPPETIVAGVKMNDNVNAEVYPPGSISRSRNW